jgi:hypothetical protein
MLNYVDSQVIPIIKFVDEQILPTHIDEFINYQVHQRLKNNQNIKNTKPNQILLNHRFNSTMNFYLILLLSSIDIVNTKKLNLKASEFEEYYKNKISTTKDIFIYSIGSSYFFALYINSQLSYINSLFLDDDFSVVAENLDDFVLATFGINIDNIYVVDEKLSREYDNDDKIYKKNNIHRLGQNIFFIKLDTSLKEIKFSNLKSDEDGYKTYLKYISILLICLLTYISYNLFIKQSSQDNVYVPNKTNFSHNQINKTSNSKDYVSQIINISDDLYKCKIVINQMQINQNSAVVNITSKSKKNLLKCLDKKSYIEILSSIQNQDRTINAKLKYNK